MRRVQREGPRLDWTLGAGAGAVGSVSGGRGREGDPPPAWRACEGRGGHAVTGAPPGLSSQPTDPNTVSAPQGKLACPPPPAAPAPAAVRTLHCPRESRDSSLSTGEPEDAPHLTRSAHEGVTAGFRGERQPWVFVVDGRLTSCESRPRLTPSRGASSDGSAEATGPRESRRKASAGARLHPESVSRGLRCAWGVRGMLGPTPS